MPFLGKNLLVAYYVGEGVSANEKYLLASLLRARVST